MVSRELLLMDIVCAPWLTRTSFLCGSALLTDALLILILFLMCNRSRSQYGRGKGAKAIEIKLVHEGHSTSH